MYNIFVALTISYLSILEDKCHATIRVDIIPVFRLSARGIDNGTPQKISNLLLLKVYIFFLFFIV